MSTEQIVIDDGRDLLSVTVGLFDTQTTAFFGAGAQVTGGAVNVDAEDSLSRYGIDGGYLLGQKVGVGIAVGVNIIDRKTLAYIGSDSPNSDSLPAVAGATPHIDVSGAVNVTATEKGNVFALALAAAVLTEPDNKPTEQQPSTGDDQPASPACGQGGGLGSLGGVQGFGATSLGNTQAGGIIDSVVPSVTFAAGVSVAFNDHESIVKAFIDDPSVRAESVNVAADSTVEFRAIVIGGAVDTRAGSTNIGVGAAIAVNNMENSSVEAYIREAEIVTTGTNVIGPSVSVHATNHSTIYSDGGGVALVLSRGTTSSTTNLAVGISVAINAIDTDVLAFLDSSTVDASGDISVNALLTPTIDALTIGGALAVSSSSAGSVLNLAGAGAASKNVIHAKAHAYVIDTDPVNSAGIITRNGGDLIVSATDDSNVTADGGAVAVALSLSATGNYTNLGFAVSVAINEITNDVAAFVKDSSANIAGDIQLTATSEATIDALTIGGAVTAGGSFSGAGSGNTIRNTILAYIDGGTGANGESAIKAIGDVSVVAMDASKVIADAGGVSVVINISKSGGPTLSGSFGIGAAVNDIENTILSNIRDTLLTGGSVTVDAKSMAEIDVLSIGGSLGVGFNGGSAFSFNGAGAGSGNTVKNTIDASIQDLDDADGDTLVRSTIGAITVSAMDTSTIKADAGAVAFSLGISQGNSNINLSVGVSIAINDVKNSVLAYIDDAEVISAGAVAVSAKSTSTIDALTIAGAGALGLQPSGASGFGLQFAGAGTGSGNTIDGSTFAYIAGDAEVSSAAGTNVTVTAMDSSTIKATAVSGSLSAQLGSGGSIAIGASIAKNVIDSDVLAYIDDALVDSAGNVIVSATSSSRIEALTVAVAFSLNINTGQSVSIAGSGAGAQSTNTVTNSISASIRGGSRVTTIGTGDVILTAMDESTIKADSGGGSLAVSASPKGFSGAFGVSAGLSYNTVRNSILGFIDGAATNVSAADDIVITADSKAKIDALAVSVAGAVAIVNPTAGFALAMVGAGAESNNTIDNTISAYIGNSAVVASVGDIELTAIDDAKIKAEVPAFSFVVSIGVGLSTSVTLSNNTISNKVDAYIGNSRVTSTSGDISLDAQSNGKVEAFATAVSLNISIGGSGQGGKSVSQIIGHTQAHIDAGANVSAALGDVNIASTSTSFTNAENKGGGLGLLSITALLADSTISAPTKAYIEGATISAGGLRISSSALGKDGVTARTAKSKVVAGTVAIVGGGGGKATSTVSGAVEAYSKVSTVNINQRVGTSGAIKIEADSTSVADADTPGGSGGGVTVTALLTDAITSGATRAYADRSNLSASVIDIVSTANNLANAHLLVANVSVAGGGGGKATAKQLADTEAYATLSTLAFPFIGVPGSRVKIDARSTSTALAKAEGGGFGIVNASAFESLSTIGEKVNNVVDAAKTSAYLGSGVQLANFGNLIVDADSTNTAGSDLLSVSIGGAGISSAHAKSNVYADTEAYIGLKDFGFPVAITMPLGVGGVDVNARSRTNVTANETAGGGGGLAIASAFTETNLDGTTTAFIGDFTNIVARDINVHSEILGATAYANLLAATGGLVSIGSTKATVDAKPKATAYIGKNVNANAANIDILAIGRGEADAQCNSSGGGVLQVGVANAKSIIDPTVDAYIGTDSNVNASGNIKVKSQLLADIAAPPSDIIMDSPDDADSLAVNVDQDTVDFNIRVGTGDQLVYDAPALAPSFGLIDNRAYNVIVVEPGQSLQLGDEFNAAKLDGDTDRIIFDTPHAFKPGDAIRYNANGGLSIVEPWQTTLATNDPNYVDPNGILYVRGIFIDPSNPLTLDQLSIRLARTSSLATASEATLLKSFDAATEVDPTTDDITLNGHGFADGQAVTYRAAASSTFLTEAVDVNVVDRTIKNGATSQTVKDIQRDKKDVGLHFDNNNILLQSHNFSTGDAVTYTSDHPIGGLTTGTTYFVIKIDADQIKLARTYHEAVGLPFDDRGNSDPADDILGISVTPIQLSPSSGQAHMHHLSRDLKGLTDGKTYYVVSPAANTFQLAATRGGLPIDIDHSDDIDIKQRNGDVANTTRSLTRSGTHRVGTLGIDLRPGTETQSLRIDLTGQPLLGNHRLLGGIAGRALGDGKSFADGLGGSGGAIDVSVPTGNLTSAQLITAHVDATSVTAGGDVEIVATSTSSVSSKADTGGGGIASIGEAHSDTVASQTTSATVGKSTRIQAGRDFLMDSVSNHSTSAVAKSVGGGAFATKVAETTSKLTGNTHSTISDEANVSAGRLLSVHSTSHANGSSSSDTYAVAFGAFADSDNTNGDRGVSIVSPTSVVVGKGAVLEAESVDLNANIGSTFGNAAAKAIAYSPVLIGVATAFADASVSVASNAGVLIDAYPAGSANQTKITGRRGVDIQAHTPNVLDPAKYIIGRNPTALAVALIPPQNSRALGTSVVTSTIVSKPEALIVAGTRGTGTPLVTRPSVPDLAIYVDADFSTTWNADVEIRGGASPELVVDANGNITTQVNVNATVDSVFQTVNVTGVTNTGPGQVLFEGDGTVSGIQSTFSFRRTLDRVDITTNKYKLFVGDLSVANKDLAGTEPKVTIDVPTVKLEFDVDYPFRPTEINIQNFDPAPDQGIGIRMEGLIDNPVGTTKLIAPSGGIYSANFRQRKGVVRTNRLEINAGTDAGGTFVDETDRIPIDIVESPGLPAHMSVMAGRDINVGIQGLQRGPSSTNFVTASDPTPSLFMAGEKSDIMLLGGLQQTTVTVPANFGIQVFETSRVTTPLNAPNAMPTVPPRTTKVINHFRVSSGNAISLPASVFGTGNTPIDVTYDLGLIKAGTSIDVYKDDPVTSRVNILSDTDIVSGANNVNIDSRTNGFIDLTETNGDMRIGEVRSTNNDVRLTATAGSILDVPNDLSPTGDAAADAIGINLTLTASQLIGVDPNRFEIDSSNPTAGVVDATANSVIYLTEVDDGDAADDDFLNVGHIKGIDVTLESLRGGILDAKNDFAADVVGNHVELVANRPSPVGDAIGQAGNDLEIDSSFFDGGHLDARSNGNIRITETNDELYVRRIAGIDAATRPDAFITVRDTGSSRNDMIIQGQNQPGFFVPGSIEARDAFLTAGDDFQLPADGTINASRAVNVNVDPPTGDPDAFGSLLAIDTRIAAETLQLTGGDDFDVFETVLHTLPAGNEVKVFGGEPRYPVFPGDQLLVDTLGNNVSHPPFDQASIEQGRGILTSPGFAPINYVSIELIDRTPTVTEDPMNHDFPVVTGPPSLCVKTSTIDFSAANGNPIRVFDYDATVASSAGIAIEIFRGPLVGRTAAGTLSLLDPNLPSTGNGMPGSRLQFSGSFARLNQALASGIRYTPSSGLTGTVTLLVVVGDSHNLNVAGGGQFVIEVGCTNNNPPVNILPPSILTDQTNVTLSDAIGNKLSVADLDAGNAANFMVTLGVPTGSLFASGAPGVTVVGDGTPALPMMLTGSLANINAALASGVHFAAPSGFTGVVPLTMISDDKGNTGNDGPKTDTDVLSITIGDLSDLNDPPVNHFPEDDTVHHVSEVPVVLSGGTAIQVTDIDAGNADDFLVSLSVPFGKLSLDNSIGVTVAGKGLSADPLTLTGTLANINTVLTNGLRYLPPHDNFLGSIPLTVVSDDRGNTGEGGPMTDTDVLFLSIEDAGPGNAPPVNQLPASVTTSDVPFLFSVANENNLFVTDLDAGNSPNFFVSLSVSSGNLALTNPTGITAIFGNGSAAAPLGLRGTLASINEALARGLLFLSSGPAGTTTLTIISNDGGATGVGGPLTDTDTMTITVVEGDSANDPPVNHVPGSVTTEKLPIVFSQLNGNPLFVTDVDAGNNDIMVKLTTPDGRLSLASSNNLTVSGVGTVDSPLMLTGSLTNINSALLLGVTFVPKGGFTGATSLTINSNDKGNTGTGGTMQDTDSILINVIDANSFDNDPPVNHLPPNVTTSQVPVVFSEANSNMIAVTDVDAGDANNFMVSLSVANGILSLADKTGLTVTGNGSSATPLMLTGKLADIDTALAAGVTFFPPGGFSETTTLTVVSNDKGNTGSGVELTDTDSFTITILDPNPGNNDAPVNHLPPPIVSDQLPTVLSYANNNFLYVTDVDSGNTPNFMVSLSVPVGTLFLASNAGVTVAGNGTSASPLMLTGTLDNINKALLTGLQFLPPVGFLGMTTLTIHSNDKGNTGVFGSEKTDTDELDITIVDHDPNNDPPINHLPPPVTSNQVPFFLSTSNGNQLYVTDIDVGNASNFSVALTLAEGKLKLPNSTGLTVSGNGTSLSPLTLTGKLEDINTALASGLQVLPFGDYLSGKTLLTINSNDHGNTGIGHPGIDIDTLEITIVDLNPGVNNPPENHVVTPVTTPNVPVVFSEINGNELFVTDIDAGTVANFMVTLSVENGTLSILSSTGLTASGVGTAASPLMLTGRLDDINNALATGLQFLPATGFVGTSLLTIFSNDKSAGGELTDTDFISITITDTDPNNNPPINHVPADFATDASVVVLSEANGNKLLVTDVDAGNATDFMVTLSVGDGTLSLVNSADLTVTGDGTTVTPLMLTGTLANINARLAAGLQFTPTPGVLGPITLSMVSNDKGHSVLGGGLGPELTDSDAFDITITNSANDPPVNKLPAPFETNQLPIELSGATGRALSVSDVDAGNANNFMVTLSVDAGSLQLSSKAGLTVSGNGKTATPLMVTGKLSDINAALNTGLRFLPPGGFTGLATLKMISDDKGNTGTGGRLTDTDTLTITIKDFDVPNNNPPINHLPPSVATSQPPVVFSEANGNQLYVTDIDAGKATNFMVSLAVANGMLILSNPAGVTLSGEGTIANPLMLTGTLAKIDEVLAAGVQFVPNGFLGTTTLTIKSDDKGNTGLGGAKTDTDTLSITIFDNDVNNNDPPVNHLPAPIVTNNVPVELSQANGNRLFVTDIDAGVAGNFTVQLHVGTDGTLSLLNRTDLSVSGDGSLFGPLLLTGSLDTINRRLVEGLRYVPTGGFQGTATLTILSNDNGNTGAGVAMTDLDTLSITIGNTPENDPPVNVLPKPVTFGQLRAILSSDNFNALAVADVDAGFANNFTVSLSVADGRLSLFDKRSLTVSGNGTPGSPLTLIGMLVDINERLAAGLEFIPGRLGSTILTIVSDDMGNSGTGEAKTDTDTLALNLVDDHRPINDPPVNYVPPNFTTSQLPVVLSELNGNQLSVADIDAGDAKNFMVTLSVPSGELNLKTTTGLTVSGNGTNSIMVTGTMVDINSALAAGLSYLPPAPFVGQTILIIESNDKGNTGSGGPKSAANGIVITVADADSVNNDAPINHLPPKVVSNQLPTVLSKANGNRLFVTDIDAGNAANFMVSLSVPLGKLSLLSNSGVAVNGNGTPATPLMLTGTLGNINTALATGLSFLPPTGFLGTTKLTIVSNDKANAGAGGAKTDTDMLDIEIADLNPANDPPVNLLPPAVVSSQVPVVLSSANNNELIVTDIDAGLAANFMVTLTVANGLLTLPSTAGLAVSGNGSVSSPLMLTGSLVDINSALANGLQYNSSGFLGTTTLTIFSNDKGNSGPGRPLTDTDTVNITIVDSNPANNDPPVNHLPPSVTTDQASITFSTANGNPIFVTDIDAGNASNFMVTLTVDNGSLVLSNPIGVTVSGLGSIATPLMLTGTLADINNALAFGLQYNSSGFLGTTILTVVSNDKGNTGSGALTDTDSLSITITDTNRMLPQVVSVLADSSAWTSEFRDYVDGTFTDPSALGYPLPKGTKQLETLPWVNINRLKVRFNKDVGASLGENDFQLTASTGYGAFGIPPGIAPTIQSVTYDVSTFTATLALNKFFPAAVVDLKILAAGVFDRTSVILDGEWSNGGTLGNSGNNVAGGDFVYRIFVLPGDTRDETGGTGVRVVNSNDALRVRDTQNGFALPGVGVFGYDRRADLDGSSFINSDDSQFERDQQNAIIVPPLNGAPPMVTRPNLGRGQNPVNRLDVNGDGLVTARDVLLTINALNRESRGLPRSNDAYLDVSGDNALSSRDVLMVINGIRRAELSNFDVLVSMNAEELAPPPHMHDELEFALDQLALDVICAKRPTFVK